MAYREDKGRAEAMGGTPKRADILDSLRMVDADAVKTTARLTNWRHSANLSDGGNSDGVAACEAVRLLP